MKRNFRFLIRSRGPKRRNGTRGNTVLAWPSTFTGERTGFAKDETVAVVAVENDALKVQRADGSESIFPLGAGCACFDVGEKRKLKIAAGDKLLLQANASRKRFINGELVEVLAIQGDSVVLADGRVIPQNYRTFTHGYAVTSHAAQGKTVDEVLVVASSRSLPAINQQQFYVSISRGRDACRVFTDDAEMLRSHVTRSSARLAAVEVVPRVHQPKIHSNHFAARPSLSETVPPAPRAATNDFT